MNILILNWRDPKNPKAGGAEIVTMEHARAWVKNGHAVTWFTSKFPKSKKQETIDGVNIVRRGSFLTVYLYAIYYYLFSDNNFDLVIDEIHGLPFFTPLYVRKPKIAFIHEVAGEIWDYMYPFPINKFFRLIEPSLFILYKNITFITVSDSTKSALQKLGIKDIHIITNGLTASALHKLSTKEDAPTFIFVSRIVKMKGIEEVMKAFFYILKELKDAHLWIVGDGEKNYIGEIKNIMKSYSIAPKVRFFGRVKGEKKLELMGRAHIFLHASVKEGWGLVVVEAASQATPSVVYNIAGLRDSVKNGKTGIVLAENNPREMAREAINLVIDHKRYKEYQRNCLQWAKSLTWEKATKQSEALLSRVLKGKN